MRKKLTLYGYLLLGMVLFFSSCNPNKDASVTLNDFALDTTVRIKIYGTRDESPLQKSLQEIRRLESLLSVHKEGSEIQQLNQHAGQDWVEISPETEEILKAALYYGDLSQEKLNITAGPLIDLWAIDPPDGYIPSPQELKDISPLMNLHDLKLEAGKARLEKQGMRVNLGAIAKGYIADQCKDYLKEQGFKSGLINLGGNILAIGSKPGNNPFRIGIQDPLSLRGENIGILEIRDQSMVTSGDYERFFVDEEGNRYHHILDPDTGFPAERGLHQVTILSETSMEGDALSTTLFLLGLKAGRELIENRDHTEAIFVTTDKKVYLTSGLEEQFIFTGDSRGYQLIKD